MPDGENRSAGPTICLSMIVKDEVEVLPELFASCRDLIDYWVICDTGSTDGTQDLIRRELADIPGELHERPWVDFGTNRSEVIGLARGKADYLLILDADTSLEAPPDAFRRLDADAYLLRHLDGDTRYYTKRLVRADLPWRYIGAVHEYIFSEEEETTGQLEAVLIRPRSVGAQRSGRWERDIELLRESIERNPSDARSRFYLAQTLRDLGDERDDDAIRIESLKEYRRRAEMVGWDEETYAAGFEAGRLAERLGDWPGAMMDFMRAWERRPRRLEAVHGLVVGLRERGFYHTAHRLARMAGNLNPLPMPDDTLFVRPWIYEWGMLFEYSITAYWVGEFQNSFSACKRLLSRKDLPPDFLEATKLNLQYALRENARVESERREAARPKPKRVVAAGTSTRRRS